jgi:nitroreductase
MKKSRTPILDAIFQRRAVKVFESVEISEIQRQLILEAVRFAPSSFNMQPYRFYWVQSSPMRKRAAQLCMGQSPAQTASALIIAVADIGSWRSTAQAHLQWVRQSGFITRKFLSMSARLNSGSGFSFKDGSECSVC